jgi:tRNA (guanine37-N1)-methyltransferase
MRFDIITIFPDIFDSYFNESILARAQKKRLIKIGVHDLRRWTNDRHKTVDDKPYGGGPGMVFKIEPIYKAVQFLSSKFSPYGGSPEGRKVQSSKLQSKNKNQNRRIILFSAKGKQFTQVDARRLAKYGQLILICGRYEGVDERVAKYIADEEMSVGNFVLTGGEIPAMIVVDAVARLIPGVLGKKESLLEESHSQDGYMEYPQFTRPEKFKKWNVPDVLLSGNHKKIEEWKKKSLKLKN